MNALLVRAPFGFPFREIENTGNAGFGLMLKARIFSSQKRSILVPSQMSFS